jgi:glycerate 2-kinase
MNIDCRALLLDMFRAAVESALPATCLPRFLPSLPKGRTVVVGAGKAAAAMAAAVEANWSGPLEGLVITRDGHGVPCRSIEVVEASHPVPDVRGLEAARRIIRKVSHLNSDDLVLVLISGGASSLLVLPAAGIDLEDKRKINKALLACGAQIGEMNTVRKHLSAIKGGRLAVASAPARVVTLAISDVPGDDPSVIGSGPTVGDRSTRLDALSVLAKYNISVPAPIEKYLNDPASETPKSGDTCFDNSAYQIIARPQCALEAAAQVARNAGVAPLILGSAIEGEAREVGIVHAGIARQCGDWGQPLEIPCVLISGGETTVTIRGKGRGGRNAEFLLSLGLAAEGRNGIWAFAGDTDGVDGSEDNAGAILQPDFWERSRKAGFDPRASLAENDAYSLFSAINGLVLTGPTRTNVNDFRAVLVTERS